jgi:hypothetical protein
VHDLEHDHRPDEGEEREMSDHSVSCTIVNQTSGTMVLAGSAPNKNTDLKIASNANAISAGSTASNAFTGSNNAMSGCGGTVTYTLPNNQAVLIIAYNTSTSDVNTYCFPMLKSNNSEYIGCDSYYCTASSSAVSQDDNGVTATITVYES